MIEYQMNVEHYRGGLLAGKVEYRIPKPENTAEHLTTALDNTMSQMINRIRDFKNGLRDIAHREQNRHMFRHTMSNGDIILVYVKVNPVPEVKLEVPQLDKARTTTIRVWIETEIEVNAYGLSMNPTREINRAINAGNKQERTGYVTVDEAALIDADVTYHPEVDIEHTEFELEGE